MICDLLGVENQSGSFTPLSFPCTSGGYSG